MRFKEGLRKYAHYFAMNCHILTGPDLTFEVKILYFHSDVVN